MPPRPTASHCLPLPRQDSVCTSTVVGFGVPPGFVLPQRLGGIRLDRQQCHSRLKLAVISILLQGHLHQRGRHERWLVSLGGSSKTKTALFNFLFNVRDPR